jgi:hypothetical protein
LFTPELGWILKRCFVSGLIVIEVGETLYMGQSIANRRFTKKRKTEPQNNEKQRKKEGKSAHLCSKNWIGNGLLSTHD